MNNHYLSSLVAGGAAGTAVDLSLFPLDTIKTRLQSSKGFLEAGGFRRIYAGVLPTILGSAPTAAVFFCFYESTKLALVDPLEADEGSPPWHHMLAAIVGEVSACVIRVPVEVTKQRSQTVRQPSYRIFQDILRTEGLKGLYRGYASTVFREIPFAVIQFPLWEFFKGYVRLRQNGIVHPWQSALCGSLAGAIAAAATTPLDVAKTRIMLAERQSAQASGNVVFVLRDLWFKEGLKGLFSGIAPRVLWITVGGFVFLGVYDKVKNSFKTVESDGVINWILCSASAWFSLQSIRRLAGAGPRVFGVPDYGEAFGRKGEFSSNDPIKVTPQKVARRLSETKYF